MARILAAELGYRARLGQRERHSATNSSAPHGSAPPMAATMLPELTELQAIVAAGGAHLQQRTVCEVSVGDTTWPVLAITLGNTSPAAPAIGFVGGVHGLERIGAEIVIAHLASLVARIGWDTRLHRQLESLRLVSTPIVNPGGMAQAARANPRGVDLMRNSPAQADAAWVAQQVYEWL